VQSLVAQLLVVLLLLAQRLLCQLSAALDYPALVEHSYWGLER
jgi:hypothetical protein